MELRPYQQKTISALRNAMRSGDTKLIMCAPTGAGKTVMFTFMLSQAIQRGKKALILTHRTELLTQAGGALESFELKPQDINPKLKELNYSASLSVAMAQTLKRRLDRPEYKKWLKSLDIIIVDEAHTQDSDKVLDELSTKCFVIGATATPYRDNNKRQLKTIYSQIIEEVKISELIDSGFLAIPKYFGVPADLSGIKTKGGDYDPDQMGKVFSERKLYHGVYENYISKCPGKKAIIFAPSVESSIELVNDFLSKGIPIRHIDANTPTEVRKFTLKWFKETNGAMISNVGILNAGFDEPTIEVVILYRATKSISLYLQMCGRGSRIAPGKTHFMILDFGENIKEHGYWHDQREWFLETKKKHSKGLSPEKECPNCTAKIPVSVMICPYCQFELPPPVKSEDEKFADLVEMMSYSDLGELAKNATFRQLEIIAETKKYHKNWIIHKLQSESDLRAYAKYKGYANGWVERQKQFKNF